MQTAIKSKLNGGPQTCTFETSAFKFSEGSTMADGTDATERIGEDFIGVIMKESQEYRCKAKRAFERQREWKRG
jgi:hypothetical protein